jgi:hypothetical protein
MIQEMSPALFSENFAAFASPQGGEEAKLATELIKDAAKHAAGARRQRKYAVMARELIGETTAPVESRAELSRIAAWHYERCADGFRRSVVSCESAAKIQRSESARRRLLKKAATLAEAAEKAQRAGLELRATKKTGGSNNETG